MEELEAKLNSTVSKSMQSPIKRVVECLEA